jgi:hypothetical protein
MKAEVALLDGREGAQRWDTCVSNLTLRKVVLAIQEWYQSCFLNYVRLN